MNKKQLQANVYLLLAAAIWGFAFVAQRVGGQHIGSFTMNGIRFALGALTLLPFLFMNPEPARNMGRIQIMKAGLFSGLVLFVAASMQQMGLVGTSAGKSAFITGLYLVLVPFFGLLLRRVIGVNAWLGTVCAFVGLYFLCMTGDLMISRYDLLLLGCAVFFAIHILLIDHYASRVPVLQLAFYQFLTCSVLSLAAAAGTEAIAWPAISQAAVPILYSGICSVGIAYTLQIIGQKNARPTSAAVIMSMEAPFALIGGFLLLRERMDLRGLAGITLMLAGIILTQVPLTQKIREQRQ